MTRACDLIAKPEKHAASEVAHVNIGRHCIAIVLITGFALGDVAAISQARWSTVERARSGAGESVRHDIHLLSASGGIVTSASSVSVLTSSIGIYPDPDHFDAVFVAGTSDVRAILREARLAAWLRQAISQGVAAFPPASRHALLGAAGLAQGSSSQRDAEQSFPAPRQTIQSDARAAVCPAETPFTSILRQCGMPEVSEPVQATMRWMNSNYQRPITINEGARIAIMSQRNFLRRFKAETGMSPSRYLLYTRLDASCRLLVGSDLPVDKIAYRSGIGGGGRLSKLFRMHLATTPSDYRANNRRTMIAL